MNTLSQHSALDPERLPRPFSIGLRAVDVENWIVPDLHLADQLRQKQALFAERHDGVFRAEPDTRKAQAELLEMMLGHLPRQYPDIWQVGDGEVVIVPAGITYKIKDFAERPLELACRLVQDDLVIMRKGRDGYRIAAAAVCFPSTWVLADKFGKAIADVHGPVPGFGRGTRTAGMIDRIFDNLKPGQLVERCNWSIYEMEDLHHPASHSSHSRWQGKQDNLLLDAFMRAERQTLRRLPMSADVVFTIQIVVDAAAQLKAHPQRGEIAAKLHGHIAGLSADELAYKGLTDYREAVLAELEQLRSAVVA